MIFSKYRNLSRWVIIITSFGIISLILWNTYIFFQKFKAEERTKMEIWSAAQTQFLEILTSESSNDLNSSLETDLDLILNILGSNTSTPMIVVDNDYNIKTYSNIGQNKYRDSIYVSRSEDSVYVYKNLKKINYPIRM